jgi:hypothetical protein
MSHLSRVLTVFFYLLMTWDLITCFLLSVLRLVHCGCLCCSAMLLGIGWLLVTAQHSRRVKISTTTWQEPEISHCSLLLSVSFFKKMYLKSCLQEAYHIDSVTNLCLNIMWLDNFPVNTQKDEFCLFMTSVMVTITTLSNIIISNN